MPRPLQFQLVEVDPQKIKFSSANPRKHRGTELLRLMKSIEEVGMVQLPTIRQLPDGFAECIDGEGRILFAKENHLKTILALSVGVISDHEAATMLQAANSVRSFGFLGECRGLANLYRQGDSTASLAERFRASKSLIREMIAVGSFPEELHTLIFDDIARSEERAERWTQTLLFELLPLRQKLPGKGPSQTGEQGEILEDQYDYTEVRIAIEKVIRGEISDATQMYKYAARRRLELYEARFNKDLQMQLAAELEQAKQTLLEDYTQQAQRVEQETAQRYEDQVKRLQQQIDELDKRYQKIIKETARRPEIIEKLQKELQQNLQKTEEERQRLQLLQKKVQEEASFSKRQLEADVKRKLEEARQEQRAAMDQKLARERADWEAYYSQKDQERQLKAETTIRQLVTHATKQLADAQLSMLHLLSPGIFKGVPWLRDPEMMALLAQMQAVRETLEKAEEQFLHGENIASTEAERNPYHESASFH